MDEPGLRPRRVFILGRGATLDVERVAGRVVAEGVELVLMILADPVDAGRSVIVGDALRLAAVLRLWLDAVLVSSTKEIAELIRSGDDVTLLAVGSERRKIERELKGKVPLGPAQDTSVAGTARDRGPSHRPAGGGIGHRLCARQPALVGGSRGGSSEGAGLDGGDEDAEAFDGSPGAGSAESGSESVEALAGHRVLQPALDTVWTRDQAVAKKQAPLRVYLGSAPGVGKTFAMLSEGQRRKARGTDVVVGVVETYDGPRTIRILQGLEILPPREVTYRGTIFRELDAEALISRHPHVALIDELAHTNVPGSARAKRWEDVMDLLAQGIEVVTTLNVQHLASLNDLVAQLTGIRQQETVPDWVLDLADQVELVDMSPHALQRRMLHGNVYPDPRKADLALRRYFTVDNLTALRELALMRVANQVDESLLARWSKTEAPETRERVLVCVSRPELSEKLVRRAARIAQRAHGDLLVAHVATGRGPRDGWVERTRKLTAELGGQFEVLEAEDAVDPILAFAYQQRVTQIVVGESLRSKWQERIRGSFVNRLIQKATNVDVHVIARRER